MELTNAYDVAIPLDTLWAALEDVERLAPFVPGFELVESDGDVHRGTSRIKVGAITVSYNAEIEVLERDAAAHRVVIEMTGRERRGPGSVRAHVTASLAARGGGARIDLLTDLQLTGKVAQFGGSVIADVGSSLLGQFVAALEADLAAAPAGDRAGAGPAAAAEPARAPAAAGTASAAVLDVGALAGPALLRRAAPAVALAAAVGVFGFLLGRSRR